MEKRIITAALLLSLLLCGCGSTTGDNGNTSVAETAGTESRVVNVDSSVNSKASAGVVAAHSAVSYTAPEGSITFEEVCVILDRCSYKDLYLPQSVSDYEKICTGITKHNEKDYYQVYFYLSKGEEKVFMGTSCLVACDGKSVSRKNWFGTYEEIGTNKAKDDPTWQDIYPGAAVTPNEAMLVLLDKSFNALGLQYELSQYVFEVKSDVKSIEGIECYSVIPKIETGNAVTMLQNCYISTDGSNTVFVPDSSAIGKYKRID